MAGRLAGVRVGSDNALEKTPTIADSNSASVQSFPRWIVHALSRFASLLDPTEGATLTIVGMCDAASCANAAREFANALRMLCGAGGDTAV